MILHHIILAVNLDKGKSKGKNQNIIMRMNCCNVYEYARTIVSDAFLNATKQHLTFKYIKEDSNKSFYIDYIHYIMYKQSFDSKRIHKILQKQGICKELKKSYDPKNTLKISVRQKYGWTISLFSRNKIDIILL